jgi:hypothetical protein
MRRLYRFAGRLRRPLGPFGPGSALVLERRLTPEELRVLVRWYDPACSTVTVRSESSGERWGAVTGIWPSAVAEPPTAAAATAAAEGDSAEGSDDGDRA